ncbi:hypothetical protein F5Y04DRAFT_290690 [Hypomontagnella monticulosa]|nr:hypothetical protein F5Y04DRAFT_290690 [Hypomontagnella monticulosa]
MTKQWDVYEATIKELYAENTLAVVRQIMIDQYGFKASVRAYRGRLIRWGIRKYNCRKRASSSASGSGGSIGDFSSGSEAASPTLTAASSSTATASNAAVTATSMLSSRNMSVSRRPGDGHLAMPPGRMSQHYGAVSVDGGCQAPVYSTDNSYSNKPKALLSPPNSQASTSSGGSNTMQYSWDSPSSSSTAPPLIKRDSDASSDLDSYHQGADLAPPSYFGSYATPMVSGHYATSSGMGSTGSVGYEDTGHGGVRGAGMGYYEPQHQHQHQHHQQQRGRQDSGQIQGHGHTDLAYGTSVRDYEHGG